MNKPDFMEQRMQEWKTLSSRCETCRTPFEFNDSNTKIRINGFYFCPACAKDAINGFIMMAEATIEDKQDEIRKKHCKHCKYYPR